MIGPFPIDNFLARFPEFDNEEEYSRSFIANCGQRASMHVTHDAKDMPMGGPYREYALFLMTGHLITLEKNDESAGGEPGAGMAGTPFKATVGSVAIESTKPNTFTQDDWTYWLNQTKYGRELLAYLETQVAPGIFINTPDDSVRDLI